METAGLILESSESRQRLTFGRLEGSACSFKIVSKVTLCDGSHGAQLNHLTMPSGFKGRLARPE